MFFRWPDVSTTGEKGKTIMNFIHHSNTLRSLARIVSGLLLAAAVGGAAAAVTDLADEPLANSTTTPVLPNIMLDFDASGSMGLDHMPDYISKNYSGSNTWCRGPNSYNTLAVCEQGDPPYFANAFNGLYYNPAFRYKPPVNADGTSKTSYGSPWTSVASDGYGKQQIDNSSASSTSSPCTAQNSCPTYSSSATVNLAGSYPERVWCKSSSDTPPSPNCMSALDASNNYIYPNATYKYLKLQYGNPYYYNVSVEWCKTADTTAPNQNYGKAGTCQAKKTTTYKYVRFYNWSRVDIKLTTVFPPKAAGRTDCAGAACTYDEEMTNFANWFAWYRTRLQMAKTAIGLAFKDVRGTPKTGAALLADPTDSDFLHARIGFTTISNSAVLNISNFDTTPKTSFYTNLYGLSANSATPLRTSLNEVGKMYSGASQVFSDPVQYSCQKNFAILITDGYWNDSYSGVGDTDGAAGVTKPSYDALKTANTLADVAYYYYHTDLRSGICTLCTDNVPPTGTNPDVDDTAQHQHMTTFTVGMGVDGTLTYQSGYKTSTSGDYFDIKQGTKNWPAPTSNSQQTIDDLWHAAVNGRGTYFSARDPNALQDGLERALGSIDSASGSGAAAATSNLQPTTGDNAIYIATYRTVYWDGEMSAYTVDLGTGVISATPTWQADSLLKAKIAASGDSDTRTIYTADGTTRILFKVGTGGLTAAQQAYFDNTKLGQYVDWSDAQKSAATTELLVNYLRGQDRNENQDRDLSYGSYQRLYRDRDKVLGDIVHSQPIYVKAPPYNFTDDGYLAYKTANTNRQAMLYFAANDGMLHALDASSGQESWAYIPPLALPDLWRLADKDYSTHHRFYLDGPLVMADAKISGVWKTVLIGALGKGGRGYYALDVTDPANPQPLWNFSVNNEPNIGYTYGVPFVTKLADGTWVALVTSGYNNVPEGSNYPTADGVGRVFVLDLATGNVLKTISTGAGSVAAPSGLARLNVKVNDFSTDNTAIGAYGGDLLGNMWRFNLDAGTATKLVSFGTGKPIMAGPEIGDVDGTKVIFFGTGRYLGESDLDDTSVQSIYGIKDDGSTTITNTSQLVAQTLSGTGSTRNITKNTVDWATKFGWYVDLPDSGERIALDPQLFFGTLVVASTVPTASECQPGGYSWLYQLDYRTGGYIGNVATAVGVKYTSPTVGLTVSKLPTGTPVIYPITADGKKASPIELRLAPPTSIGGVRRVIWRELFD